MIQKPMEKLNMIMPVNQIIITNLRECLMMMKTQMTFHKWTSRNGMFCRMIRSSQ